MSKPQVNGGGSSYAGVHHQIYCNIETGKMSSFGSCDLSSGGDV